MKTRRKCTDCRLAKCLLVGMSSDLIRKQEQQRTKHSPLFDLNSKNSVLIKQETFAPQQWKLDFSRESRHELLHSEQKLLSNIAHAFNTYNALPQIRRVIHSLSTSCLSAHYNTRNLLKIVVLSSLSTRSILNSTPDFRILTVNEQCSLIERNFNGITPLYTIAVLRDLDTIHNYLCMKNLISMYGLSVIQQAVRFYQQLDNDPNIVKVMLIILAFSSNCSIIDSKNGKYNDSLLCGTHRLLGSQNSYTELLWKYMVYNYGYYVSAVRFTRLMAVCLNLIETSANIYMANRAYQALVNGIIENTKKLLISNQNEPISLWGKD
ncbi:unnamed protein product [Adineta ricciae]|uniref:Nuclear receptor domain-containing protein n=1 Tax=Adineta ricciae TaxID=249248 RepID=A0A815MSW0_ADIRI|nr:unnamed protein product [Adineta ricciae]CAF1423916.1 unnamed protein product [Adineta ricciae]